MTARNRRLAILAGIGYLVMGFAAWAVSSVGQGSESGANLVALWAATVILVILGWRLPSSAAWMTPAVVGPLALLPLSELPAPGAVALFALLWPASDLPLALTIVEAPGRHRPPAAVAIALAVMAVVVGLLPLVVPSAPDVWRLVQFLTVAAIVGVPALWLVAMQGRDEVMAADELSSTQVTDQATYLVAALAPLLGGAVFVLPWGSALLVLALALVGLALAVRLAIRPLMRIASRADTQRDLAVAVSEAERRRLAADLHDGPLQDVLLLARRLDLEGDAEGAALARAIGEDLREMSGDLRLPMLDDLGVGPALDWLAGRVRRMTAVDVRVDYITDGRVPPDVELAAFRIAQEAITNAVRHGEPPIIVRCRTTGTMLSLSIDDAGGGLQRVAGDATGPDRLGLLNMQQRADQVGARLELRQPRSGGTQVALEWQAGVG